MQFTNKAEQIIQKYRQDEETMVRLFVQWCRNHQLDPVRLYKKAYPSQPPNKLLADVIESDDGFDELHIDNETILEVLQMFGNDDLAFVAAEEIQRLK